uniref:Uncharacterized protein n=1 Tax=Aegilops tauschii TaxID=37682 RepID=N1R0A8_AEGTA
MEPQAGARAPRLRPRPALPPFPEPTEFEVQAELVTGDKFIDDLNESVANVYTSVALLREEVYNNGGLEAHDAKSMGKSNQAAWKSIRRLLKKAKDWRDQIEEAGARPLEEPDHLSRPIPKA